VPRRVVCISHATGARGAEVGRVVAERLGFLYVDEDIVAKAAVGAGLEPSDVADEERRKSLAARILNAIAESGGEAIAIGATIPARTTDEQSGAEIRRVIRETIEQTAARGDVVIVAHAASYALEGKENVLRVLVTASPATRTQRIGDEQGIDGAQAKRAVAAADAGRRDYLKRFYKIDQELPTHYDLVANTDVLSVEDAAEIIANAAGR
jgi:cytidylate kinase